MKIIIFDDGQFQACFVFTKNIPDFSGCQRRQKWLQLFHNDLLLGKFYTKTLTKFLKWPAYMSTKGSEGNTLNLASL